MMCARAHRIVVLADATKLGHAPFHAWALLPEGWTLVTDDSATEEQLRPFRDAGVDVHVAGVEAAVAPE